MMNLLRRVFSAYSPGFSRGSWPPADTCSIDEQWTGADSSVSILIPTARRANRSLRCLATIRAHSTYANCEVLVVDNGPLPDEVEPALTTFDVRRLSVLEPFNFAANLNAAARRAAGVFLLFLNDDTEVMTPGWLEG